jgi:hypothetical protein
MLRGVRFVMLHVMQQLWQHRGTCFVRSQKSLRHAALPTAGEMDGLRPDQRIDAQTGIMSACRTASATLLMYLQDRLSLPPGAVDDPASCLPGAAQQPDLACWGISAPVYPAVYPHCLHVPIR